MKVQKSIGQIAALCLLYVQFMNILYTGYLYYTLVVQK
jgi:hypothetical protein